MYYLRSRFINKNRGQYQYPCAIKRHGPLRQPWRTPNARNKRHGSFTLSFRSFKFSDPLVQRRFGAIFSRSYPPAAVIFFFRRFAEPVRSHGQLLRISPITRGSSLRRKYPSAKVLGRPQLECDLKSPVLWKVFRTTLLT